MTYIKALFLNWPRVQCMSNGDGSVYENLVWVSGEAFPSKELLDAYISAQESVIVLKNSVFFERFSLYEKTVIARVSLDDPSAPMEQRKKASDLKVTWEHLKSLDFITTNDPMVVSFVEGLEGSNFISKGRASIILS